MERGGAVRGLVGKPERKRPLGRPRSRWEDNITIDLHEINSNVWELHTEGQNYDKQQYY